MQKVASIAQRVLRGSGVLALILGLVIWVGRGADIVPIHMALGILVVLALWTLSGLALWARAGAVLAVRGIIWGVLVVWFGLMQRQVMPGDLHWVVRAVHLLVGVVAMGFGEVLATRVRKSG